MSIKIWAKKELIATTPTDIPLWHWSSGEAIAAIKRTILAQGHFRHFRQRAVGCGLYGSTSAVDLMERGPEVIHFKVKQGTQALMIHPIVFQIGIPEIFEMALDNLGWSDFQLPDAKLEEIERPADVIDELLDELQLPCCFYSLGLYLACMVRDSRCIDFDPALDSNQTVLAYHQANPQDIPMLAPQLLPAWLAKHR
jgi:hypothetical protein